MLQRIQTVYWALTILCLGILLSGLDLIVFQKNEDFFRLSLFALKQYNKGGSVVKETMNFNFILVSILVLISLFTIFQFKKLKRQLNLAKWIMYLNFFITAVLIIFSYSGMIVSNPTSVHLNFWVSLLFVSFIFSVLAYLGVRKDKSLLDSVDRIR